MYIGCNKLYFSIFLSKPVNFKAAGLTGTRISVNVKGLKTFEWVMLPKLDSKLVQQLPLKQHGYI